MPVTNTVLQTDAARIPAGGTFRVTLGFTAESRLAAEPADVAVAADPAGCRELSAVKAGIRMLAGTVFAAGGCRMGLCTGSCRSEALCPLTGCPEEFSRALDRMSACRCGGPEKAITQGLELLKNARNRKILVIIAGEAPDGGCLRDRIQAAGAECFALGAGSLRSAVSEPVRCHLVRGWAPEDFGALADLVAGTVRPVIRETLAPDFVLGRITASTGGKACIIPPRTLQWKPGTLGLAGPEKASITFEAFHVGEKTGRLPVSRDLRFSCPCQPEPVFPQPELTVGCGKKPVCPQPVPPCPGPCREDCHICVPRVRPDGGGRLVHVHVTLRDICPNRRVALAVLLYEDRPDGSSTCVGRKILTVPAHPGPGCRDIPVDCIPFAVPEKRNISDCASNCLCSPKHFHVQIYCNYIGWDSTAFCEFSELL